MTTSFCYEPCGGKITFVTDADDFSVEAQRKQNFRSRGAAAKTIRMDKMYHTQLQGKRKKLKRVRLRAFARRFLLGDRSAWGPVYL